MTAVLFVVVLVAFAIAAAIKNSSSSTVSSSSSTGHYWETQHADPYWASVSGKGVFGQRLAAYGIRTGYPYPYTQYQLGIDDCLALRAGQTDPVTDTISSDNVPGETWATLNTAIDVYCPDQESYRSLVPTPPLAR